MGDVCPVAGSSKATDLEDQPETVVEFVSHLWLLTLKKFGDVIFTFPNAPERIEAHLFVLKARSSVFEQIFEMKKSGNVQGIEIEIHESTSERFQQFLEFIYSDEVEVDIAGAVELFQLSQKYKVHPLTKKCEEIFQTEIPTVDSVKVFETARRYDHRELMDRAGSIIVESFIMLARTGSLANAEEETLVYLLECDDLAVKEIGLFQFILHWGRNQVGNSAADGFLKNKLKNLISKIRFTNMVPLEFTKVVLPAGLLSAEETISVYSYLCGDEITRRDFNSKFKTNRRKMDNVKVTTETLSFYPDKRQYYRFPAFRTHSLSFIAGRTEVDEKVQQDYSPTTDYSLARKIVITAIRFQLPFVDYQHRQHLALNFNVSIVEYSGPTKEENFTLRFQKKLLNCKQNSLDTFSVEPPVELLSGRMYSVMVEDHSTSDSIDSLRKDIMAYKVIRFQDTKREENVDFDFVSLSLRNIHRKTDFYAMNSADMYGEFLLVKSIVLGLI